MIGCFQLVVALIIRLYSYFAYNSINFCHSFFLWQIDVNCMQIEMNIGNRNSSPFLSTQFFTFKSFWFLLCFFFLRLLLARSLFHSVNVFTIYAILHHPFLHAKTENCGTGTKNKLQLNVSYIRIIVLNTVWYK